MNCAACKKLFSDYIDGALDSETKAQLEEHVSLCNDCRPALEELKALIGELRAVKPVKAPADFLDRLHERIEPRFGFGKIIKSLFVPMRIKIPIQLVTAMATVVLVFSIINLQQPEKRLKDASIIAEKEESKPEMMKEPAKPLPGRKMDTPKAAFKKTVAHKKPKKRGAKDIASKGLRTEKAIELALVFKTDTYRKPAVQVAPLKVLPPESSEMDDKEKKSDTGSSSIARIAGKTGKKETVVSSAVKKEKKTETPMPVKPVTLKEEADETEGDNEKITKRLKKLIKDLKGEIQSIEYDHKTGYPSSLTAVIPVDKYPVFYEKLKEMGTLHGPVTAVNEKKKEMVRVRLVISK